MDTIDPVPFLLVTANVGSVFEDVSRFCVKIKTVNFCIVFRLAITVLTDMYHVCFIKMDI